MQADGAWWTAPEPMRIGEDYGFIIDGFPRNVNQAEFFLESYDIDAVVHLDLPDDEVRRRVLARRLCSSCGTCSAIPRPRWPVC